MDSSSYRLSSRHFAKRKYLGEGGFAKVWKCWKKDTKEFVAAKVLRHSGHASREIEIMTELMQCECDKHNIVKFIGWYKIVFWTKVLVFEMLDINLKEFCSRFAPLPLCKIRPVVRQVAAALGALERLGLIHADIHAKNIMLVDHRAEPPAVKLIDFGTAVRSSDAEPAMSHQIYSYRSPEIILGLRFSPATDVWSLGVVMGLMVCGRQLFPGHGSYEVLMFILIRLGRPSERVGGNGSKAGVYVFKTPTSCWKIKIPQFIRTSGTRSRFLALNELKWRYLKNKEGAEAAEWDQCFELLEAMLKINADERITAADILAHPFIDSTEVDCRLDRRIPSPTDPHPPGTAVVQSTTREQVEEEEEEEEEEEPEG